MVKNSLIIPLVLFNTFLFAQNTGEKPKVLSVGENASAYTLQNMMNYSSDIARISDFKGKIVILDFWSRNCAACISSWPKLLALQKKYKNDVKILLINPWDERGVIDSILEKQRNVRNVDMTLPIMTGPDSKIALTFNISGLPQIIWIDREGLIRSVTAGYSLNSRNLDAAVINKKFDFAKKINNEDIIVADEFKPIFVNGNGGIPEQVYSQTVFAKAVDNLCPGVILINKGIHCVTSITQLYALAYSDRYFGVDSTLDPLLRNRVELNVEDSSKYVNIIDGEYYYEKNFVYHYTPPKDQAIDSLTSTMRSDLLKIVGLDARIELRKKLCFILSARDSSKFLFIGGKIAHNVTESEVNLNGVTSNYFATTLDGNINEYYKSPYPIVNEINYEGLIGGIRFETDVTNYRKLDKELSKYGIRFTLEERIIKVLVLSEPDGYVSPF